MFINVDLIYKLIPWLIRSRKRGFAINFGTNYTDAVTNQLNYFRVLLRRRKSLLDLVKTLSKT